MKRDLHNKIIYKQIIYFIVNAKTFYLILIFHKLVKKGHLMDQHFVVKNIN
jgi:hypothetical protein